VNWDEMAVVGRVARTHGIRGHFFVNPETDFPEERFRIGAELFVGRSAADFRRATITAARLQQGWPVIALSGVDDMTAAAALAGAEFRVPVEALLTLAEGTYYRHDLIGCRVETADGQVVGEVAAVEGSGDESRLVLREQQGEILIPLVTTICITIDPPGRRIVIAPPDGLLEVNVRERDR
jgi:16S rRNA processing protein RimM